MAHTLLALSTDPDTEAATKCLSEAKIVFSLVDVGSTGILANLARDLDVRELPVLLMQSGKIEGIRAITAFANHAK